MWGGEDVGGWVGEEGFVWERGEAERVGIGPTNLFFFQEIVRFFHSPQSRSLPDGLPNSLSLCYPLLSPPPPPSLFSKPEPESESESESGCGQDILCYAILSYAGTNIHLLYISLFRIQFSRLCQLGCDFLFFLERDCLGGVSYLM